MSEYTDFYPSWLGNNSFGGSGVRLRDQEPLIFRPTDISGCAMWFDANNNDAVVYNDLLEVSSWSNQGYVGGQFDLSGASIIRYGQTTINGLNVVSFDENSYMAGQFALNFQGRSLFLVTRENSLPEGVPNPYITSDTTNGMETFSQVNGTSIYFIGKHPSPIPEFAFETTTNYTGTPSILEFINGTDISNNWAGINGTRYPAIYDAPASGYNTSNITYFIGGYYSGSVIPSAQDWCEMILYDFDLSEPQRIEVEKYLRTKWNIQEPPPAPPAPFAPTDISGLSIWLDANNASTITLGTSNDVTGWSNLGSISNVFATESNVATYGTDSNSMNIVAFPTATTLGSYYATPYVSRTQFAVFENVSDMTTLTYPYLNIINTSASAGAQSGVSYDSNSGRYYMTMCQQGINCPVAGQISNVDIGGYNLAIFAVDSNSTTNTLGYYNGGSNINTSSDLGNLFNTFPIPYSIGSPVNDSPSFRMAEIVEYDSLLSSSNISTVANYLVNKWAISSFTTLI